MQRPEVRVIQKQSIQQEDSTINQYEADALLAKYGFKSNSTFSQPPSFQSDARTFEDMVKQQEQKEQRNIQQLNRPRAITFDDNKTSFAETKWSSLEDESGINFGIQVSIVSDQRI
jgi:hypothetical protein